MKKIITISIEITLLLLFMILVVGCQEQSAPQPTPTTMPTPATTTVSETTPTPEPTPAPTSTPPLSKPVPASTPTKTPEPTPILRPTPTEPTSILETEYKVYLAQTLPSESNVWLDLMRIIPATSDTLMETHMNDYNALRMALGIPLPDPDAAAEVLDEDKLRLLGGEDMTNYLDYESLSGLFAPFPEAENPEMVPSVEQWRHTLGFTWANVDQSVIAGFPPDNFEAVKGRFDRDTIDQAVRLGPMNDLLEDASYEGIKYYTWGDDYDPNFDRMSAVRPLGMGHRLALIEDHIFWTTGTDELEMMIDCYQGNCLSLAWVEEFQLLSQGLDELATYTAFFTAETQSLELMSYRLSWMLEKTEDEVCSELEESPLLEPYQALATGIGVDEQGHFMAVVLVHADEQAAQQNVRLLEQRILETSSVYDNLVWADRIETMEISSQGRLTLAKLYGDIAGAWIEFWVGEDPLLIHRQ